MTPEEHTLRKLEADIATSREQVELAAALERLRKNRDFKRVILDGYLRDEAIRLVHLKASPAMSSPVHQAAILADIDAIARLNEHFRTITQLGDMASRAIEVDEATREELLAEDLDDE